MHFTLRGTIETGFDALDYAVSDLLVMVDGTTTTAFIATGENGGIASFALEAEGSATFVDHAFFNPAWQAGLCSRIALIEDDAGGAHLLFGMTDSVSLGGYAVSSSGAIGGVSTFAGLEANTVCPQVLHVTGSDEILVAGVDSGFASYSLTGMELEVQSVASQPAEDYAREVAFFSDVRVNGTWFTVAASASADAIAVFGDSPTGPVVTGASTPDEGVGLMRPTAIESAAVGGHVFLIVGSASGMSGALSVFHVDEVGALTATDHVLDTRESRFGGVQDIAVTTFGGMTFVVAGGGDDGLSLFVLLPGGQLQHIDTIADDLDTGLANVSALGAAVVGEGLRILASSQAEGMLTDLEVSLANIGRQLVALADGGTLAGTTGDDILVGQSGPDSITGGAGDDVIVDGAGADSLTGGAGRDLFVMRADGTEDVITDFDPAFDRLDLSAWPMMRDRAGLTITETALGATITWRDETLVLHGANGTLDAEAVRARVVQATDRPFDRSNVVLPALGSTGGGTFFAGDADDAIVGTEYMTEVYLEGGNDVFETVFGTPGEAGLVLNGGEGNDSLTTADGDDTIEGGPGADFVSAGGGADTISGGADDDNLKGDDGDDVIHGGDGHDRLVGGAGDDLLLGEAGKDSLNGGPGDDWLDGGAKPDKLKGDDGADTLIGGLGNDRLVGGDGHDILRGEDGTDHLFGSAGNDRLFGDAGPDSLYGEADDDELHGGADDDRLYGGPGNDVLHGDEGRDELRGEDGDDTLHGGADNDRMFGEAGNDTMYGGLGSDTMNGGIGNDILWGNEEKDRMFGDLGDDLFYGGEGNDKIKGQADNDQLFGEVGNDKLIGGTGNDALHGGEGDDRLNGSAGDDWLSGDAGIDLLYGNAGKDTLLGGTGDDFLYAGLDNDTLRGGDGRDYLQGEDGDDALFGDADNDKLFGGLGADTLDGGLGDDWLFGGGGNDTLTGGDGKDRISGDDGDDVLFGDAGNDKLKGLEGNDMLSGGLGDDTLVGGPGADVFMFDFTSANDTIKDFDPAEDLLRFEGMAPGDVTLMPGAEAPTLTWAGGSVQMLGLLEGELDLSAIDFV